MYQKSPSGKVHILDVKKSKKEMEKRAIENGILDKSFDNSKTIIEKLINNEILKEQGYTLKFKEIEQ